jgi:hypothetical protein
MVSSAWLNVETSIPATSMKNVINSLGKVLFRISRIILSRFGFDIKLGVDAVFYPELSKRDIDFIRRLFAKSMTMTSFESLCTLAILCKCLSKGGIQGDFVEVGVWRGGSSLVAKNFFHGEREFFLFDTYAGMTKPSENDFRIGAKNNQSSVSKWENGQKTDHNEWVFASLEEVKKNFATFGLLDSSIMFHKGDVRETLNEVPLPIEIALLRLDTDFYDSTLIELKILWPLLVSGGC